MVDVVSRRIGEDLIVGQLVLTSETSVSYSARCTKERIKHSLSFWMPTKGFPRRIEASDVA